MSLLDRIHDCNNLDPQGLCSFMVDGLQVGWILPAFARELTRFGEVFYVSDAAVTLMGTYSDFDSRSAAVAPVMRQLADEGIITGWRDEFYPIVPDHEAPPLFVVERAAAAYLGARSFGVHLLGYRGSGPDMRIWVARRSLDKATGPGQKDALVGGGMAHGMDAHDTMVKEAWEEAGIPAALAAEARPVGDVRFKIQGSYGIDQGLDYQFELALPEDFTPENQDGEVAGFELLPVRQVLREIAETRDYFYDANLAFIAFFVRHGFIAPNDPDHDAIVAGLRGQV